MKHYQIKNVLPATCWQDATPVGNGRMTALVYGNVYADKILLNHEEWWYKESSPELPDFGDSLKKCRELMDNGDYYSAEKIYPDEMAKHKPLAAAALFQSGIDLRVESKTVNEYSNYSRRLDMNKGEVRVSYVDEVLTERTVFVSRADDVVVVRIQGKKDLKGRIWLEPHELENAVGIFGEPFSHGLKFKTYEENGLIYLDGLRTDVSLSDNSTFAIIGTTDKEKKFGAVMKLCVPNGSVNYIPYTENHLNTMMPDSEGGMEDGVIAELTNLNGVVILIKLYQGDNREQTAKELSLLDTDYDALLDRHIKVHEEVFCRATIDFADETDRSSEQLILDVKQNGSDLELLNKLWYFGRYLFVISTAPQCLPAHLSGKWNGDYFAPWRGVYFVDENTEIIYWQAFSGNMPELAKPLFGFLDGKMQDFRENAQKMFGCRGIRVPVYLDVFSGHEKDYSPHALYWNGGAAWLATMYYDYYEYTLDEEFLINRAYPFMKETMQFFEDYLVEKDGVLHCYPSTSPENKPNGDYKGAGEISVCIDAAMDVSLIKDVLKKLIHVSTTYALDEEKKAVWEEMLKKLPEYRVNDDGALAEWIHKDFKDNYEHRHLSHLVGVFPGCEIGKDHELFQSAQKALELRMANGLKDMTGWALSHTANVYARLANGQMVKKCLDVISRNFIGNNLFGYHNNDELMGVGVYIKWCNHAPHQLDVSSGFSSAVQQALCHKSNGKIYLLPAFDSISNTVTAKGIVLTDGIVVDSLVKKEKKILVELSSKKPQTTTICFDKIPKSVKIDGVKVVPMKEIKIKINDKIKIKIVV